jgi:pantetheine-phosphate adenylyltransferase
LRRIRTGIYPGTFDPIHNGHLDVIRRATVLVDELIVAVAINAGKEPLFDIAERTAMVLHVVAHGCYIRTAWPHHRTADSALDLIPLGQPERTSPLTLRKCVTCVTA